MINIGHSPQLVKKILLWLLFEQNIDKPKLIELLKSRRCFMTIRQLQAWESNPDRQGWMEWQFFVVALDKILSNYGLRVADFNHDFAYTPINLVTLRKSTGLSLSEFSELVDINENKLRIYETDSIDNVRGLSFSHFNTLLVNTSQLSLSQH